MKDEIIMEDGKPHKIAQVIMLPTENFSNIAIRVSTNKLVFLSDNLKNDLVNTLVYKMQNLYILSSEEIKEGDWCLTGLKVIRQCNGFTYSQNGKTLNGYTFTDGTSNTFSSCKKIIATTNESLKVDCNQIIINCDKSGYDGRSVCNTCKGSAKLFLPRPSDDFIKAYVKAQNKITKVLVEYEGFIGCSECGREYPFPMAKECFQSKMCKRFNNLKLKVSPDNTITIRAVEEEKKDYGIEYLKFIATRFAHECRLKGVVSNHETCTLFDKWIKENL